MSIAFLALSASLMWAQTSSQKAAVQLSATVQASPAGITLAWTTLPSTTSITIYRKLADATSWGSAIATPSASSSSYADASVSVGTAYEYKVVRVAAGVTGTGYISSGIAVAPVDYRGRMILLVDNTFSNSLSSELATLQNDLRMDGWSVARSDLSRSASVSAVKSTIQSLYNADAGNTKAVFIIGHLAVPYTGNINPDGHSEHQGAWPCDGYYGELNGSWTDNSVNNSGASRTENRNTPGDGKFDQSTFPNTVELQVGRVDFYNMPAFSQNETELLRAYLNKLHGFKVKQWTPTARGLVYDNLQWVSNPLAASAWRSMAPLVGPSNITAANQNAAQFKDLVNNQSYLWAYASGGGLMATDGGVLTYNGADRVGTTQDFAGSVSNGGVFNMTFGSYFGDWDNRNNFLRALLASGYGLTNCWSAIPGYYFHHMGMGANIGQSVLATMNNTSLYAPLTDGWQSSIGRSHVSLMGDPSLRMKMLVPPSALTITNVGGYASFAWQPSTETVDGYHLYAIDAANGAVTRITSSIVSGTSFTAATVPYVSGREYMVRAVRLITEPSGSYYNLSLGAAATTSGSGGGAGGSAPDCSGVAGGSALPGTACNDGNACTTNDTWNASCQCVGTPSTPAATITANGSTSLCTGGSVTLSVGSCTGCTYQWKRNGTNVSGATSTSYAASTAGSYTVTVTNSGGCTTTSAATSVTVGSGPTATITANGSTSLCTGGSVTLSVGNCTGCTYQWKRNGTNVSGATSSSYAASTAGSYTVVVVSGSCSSTSSAISVSVGNGPAATITASGPTSFCNGSSVALSVNTCSGCSYQWKRNGVNVSGGTTPYYNTNTAGSYTVTINSGSCSSTSAATVVTVGTAPSATITASGSTTLCSTSSVALSVSTCSGCSYQWNRNGTAISGATSSSYSASTTGSYTATVTNSGCSATSNTISVTSSAPAASITASGNTSFCSGGSVALSVASCTGCSYQWKRNGGNISGATSANYTVSLAGSYTVAVSNGGCTATSAATTVSVGTPPTATITNGSATSYCAGSSVVLSAGTCSGCTYQWKRNGSTLAGATASTYSASTTGNYTVTVTSNGCTSTSGTTVVSAMSAPVITCSSSTSAGTVSVSVTSGTGPYAYSWNTNPVQTTATANVSPGTYTVTVRSSNGCQSTCTTTLSPGAVGCSAPRTVTQGVWGLPTNIGTEAAYMAQRWSQAYPAPNYLTIGCGSRVMRFTTAQAVINALPCYGAAAILPSGTTVNPSSVNNTFVGHLVSLKISTRMDEIDPSFCASGTMLKDMVVASGTFAGWTVQQLLDLADQVIGGCTSSYSVMTVVSAVANINNGYDGPNENSGYLMCPNSGIAPQTNAGASMGLEALEPVSVFPNPTSGPVTILIPAVDEDKEFTVDLYSLTGAYQSSIRNGRMEAGVEQRIDWDASALARGAYLIRVTVGDQVQHVRLMAD
ncbi:MAG: hypothetical protein H6591_02465 [Flavobacteriales bacterium]|nr:hypothetical protein [Flavobacteriales bacterium]